jgi:hypothetical protein
VNVPSPSRSALDARKSMIHVTAVVIEDTANDVNNTDPNSTMQGVQSNTVLVLILRTWNMYIHTILNNVKSKTRMKTRKSVSGVWYINE